MAWETYKPGSRSRSGEPTLSVWKTGQIAFNKSAIEKFHLKDYLYCVLRFDKDNKKIAVCPTNSDSEANRMKIKKYSWGYLIWAKNFVKSSGLGLGKTRQLHPFYDEKEKMIVAVFG